MCNKMLKSPRERCVCEGDEGVCEGDEGVCEGDEGVCM